MASNKLRAFNATDEKEKEMDMSPMIDMVFLLLIFFIVVSSPLIVKMDPKVTPAIAYNAIDPSEKNGRIVLNVRGEDEYYRVDFDSEDAKMTSQDEVTEYVKAEVERIESLNSEYVPQLHLRGDRNTLFKFSQTAIKGAAEGGVNKVIFSVYPFEKTK